MTRTTSRFVTLLLLVAALTTAMPAAAAAQLLNLPIKIGDTVWITTPDGEDVKGIVTAVSSADIDVRGDAGTSHFELNDIWRVSKLDSTRSGTVTGAAIGAGVSLIFGSQYRSKLGNVAMTLTTGLLFSGIGTLLDRAYENKHVIYEQLSSPLTARVLEARVQAWGAGLPTLPVTIGQEVIVTTVAGAQLNGFVSRISDVGIEVQSATGTQYLTAVEVQRIAKPYPTRRGFYLGSAWGGGAGLLTGLVFGSDAAGVVLSVAIFGGIGGGLGARLDHNADGHLTIYKAAPPAGSPVSVAPIITRHSVGVGGVIAWK